MRRILNKLYLRLNGICTKHLVRKDYAVGGYDPNGLPDFVCYQCHQERSNAHTVALQATIIREQARLNMTGKTDATSRTA